MQQKTCKQCNQQYEVGDWDIEFLKRISPTFDGKPFVMPSPKLCPDCREIRRQLLRNEKSLYKRKSDKSGIDMISSFSPDKDLVVYSSQEWWQTIGMLPIMGEILILTGHFSNNIMICIKLSPN